MIRVTLLTLCLSLQGCIGLQVNITGDGEAAKFCPNVQPGEKHALVVEDPSAVYR